MLTKHLAIYKRNLNIQNYYVTNRQIKVFKIILKVYLNGIVCVFTTFFIHAKKKAISYRGTHVWVF